MRNNRVDVGSFVIFGVAAAFWFLNVAPLSAQTVSGNILGLVQDQQGALVANTNVSARNLGTGAVRQTTTEGNGTYRIDSVPAGSYEVTAAIGGFKTETRTGIVVTVGGDVAVNFSLTVGAASEKIEVTAEAPQVDTSSATMAGFVNSATIGELPLNGRDWLQLALLQPGVSFSTGQAQDDSSRSQKGAGIAISIAGGRTTDNAFRIDGLVVNDYANGGPGSSLGVNMGVDAIREFSVLTNDYSAEYGRGSGGIVNAITKSGTNQFHGTAYEFVRNSAFDARNYFDGTSVPPFRRDQYGGAIGGPIKKDKTFFFTNYEKLGEFQSQSSAVTTLSANAHNGILCANSACTQTTQIAINPKVLPYLNLYPLPNGPVTGDTGIFSYGAGRTGEENYVMGKIDHYFSSATTLTGSYSFDNTTLTDPDNYDLKSADYPTRRQNFVLSLQHLFSPTVINTARVGFSRTWAGGGVDGNPKNPALTNLSLGWIPGRTMGLFSIPGITGSYSGIGDGVGGGGFQSFGYTAPQVYEDVSWTKGRHTLRAGFSLERIDYNTASFSKPNGIWTFPSIQGFLQGTPNIFTGDFPGTDGIRAERNSIIAGYVQDDFRVRSNLTINLGVRYEVTTVVQVLNGKLGNLVNLTDPSPTIGGNWYHNPTFKNFAPRIGFAWDPFKDGKTAVRGGFGMYDIGILPYTLQARVAASPPFFENGVIQNPPASSFPNQVFQLLGPASLKGALTDTNPVPSYKAQWNFNIQRQLTRSMALTVGYVGSAGVHLVEVDSDADQVAPQFVTWNGTNFIFPIPAAGQKIQRVNPNFGQLGTTRWNGHSSYDALQVNLVQRPVKGLTYQIAYTWSKNLDNGTSTFNDTEGKNSTAYPYAFYDGNRSVSDFDVPHNLVLHFQYDLPIPAAFKSHVFTNTVFGGWQAGGIYTIQSGTPFELKISGDRAGTGSSQPAQRPNYVPGPGCSPDAVTGNIANYIMTQCFAFPAQGVLGNLGRNTLRMPMFRDLDFSLFKNQALWGEKLKMQFRAEAFNVLNNTNLQATTLTIFNGSGGLIPDAGFGQGGVTANTARQIQLGLKLIF